MRLFKKKATVRRPTGFEFTGAMNITLLRLMKGDHIGEGYEQIEEFFQGPFRNALIDALTMKVGEDEHAIWDNDNGLLVKRM